MEKLKIKEAILVEGRYDKNTLSQVVDAPIIETSGFGIFSNTEKMELLRKIAQKRGIIIFTDSDGAGFLIRNHIKGSIPPSQLKHAYAPDIYGKEKRKKTASKEGKLGVEGMKPEVILRALAAAGATMDDVPAPLREDRLTTADLYALGLSGAANSAEKRRRLQRALELPERMSTKQLLTALNVLCSREELKSVLASVE